MTITAGFRTIDRGAVVKGGEQVLLHALADDGDVNILLPAEEIPRIVVILMQLLGEARMERHNSSAIEMPVFNLNRLEFEARPNEGRDILRVVVGQTRDEAIFLSLPQGKLAEICKGILQSLGHIPSGRGGEAS
ncbi:hypothetical protein IYW40_07165 [Methylocystis sp. H4A]|uniref:hypothetical protein n=1 Tax=Methylocystis sp. H4A TaxID=2785788 RepID=UPI0018C1EE9C|nr:hypothetical protein [Methylocystis sp. H4A]MBG0801261.1 hypothetical protein [Methylocystis sp. H4A]